MSIPTPHIEVKEKGVIAKTVLMPGDPLRAKFIAEKYLEKPKQFNSVRGMLGFTGTYKGKKISVMGSGMGMASIGIYSYELFKFYDVENIVRIGSCGGYVEELKLYDVVLADKVFSESTFAKVQNGFEGNILEASTELNNKIVDIAKRLEIPIHRGIVHSSDVFYREQPNTYKELVKKYGVLGVEMEAFALFTNAKSLGKNATCLLTVSDSFTSGEVTTSEERQLAFTKMMEIALELA